MDDHPRRILAELRTKYGRSLFEDFRRTENLLRDLCSRNRREVSVLIGALREGVVVDLEGSSGSVPTTVLLSRLTRKVHDRTGTGEPFARWAVETWALTLGLIDQRECTTDGRLGTNRDSSTATVDQSIASSAALDALRSAIRIAIADGGVSDVEAAELRALRQRLGIPLEVAKRVFLEMAAEVKVAPLRGSTSGKPTKRVKPAKGRRSRTRTRSKRKPVAGASSSASSAKANACAKPALPVRPLATIYGVRVDYGVTCNGAKGMLIHTHFATSAIDEGYVAAYFEFSNGEAIEALNSAYRSEDGQACVGEGFTATSRDVEWRDFQLFMPVGELHLNDEVADSCRLRVRVWGREPAGALKPLAQSSYVEFTARRQASPVPPEYRVPLDFGGTQSAEATALPHPVGALTGGFLGAAAVWTAIYLVSAVIRWIAGLFGAGPAVFSWTQAILTSLGLLGFSVGMAGLTKTNPAMPGPVMGVLVASVGGLMLFITLYAIPSFWAGLLIVALTIAVFSWLCALITRG